MVDNIIFGKEIKGLNILNNPNTKIDFVSKERLTIKDEKYLTEDIIQKIAKYKGCFEDNIKYITEPVTKIYHQNTEKITDILQKDDSFKKNIYCGVHIQKHPNTGYRNLITTSYFYTNIKDATDNFFVAFVEDKTKWGYKICVSALFYYDDKTGEVVEYNPTADDQAVILFMAMETRLSWFLEHTSIEPEMLGPRGKLHEQECKYENHTNHSIEIIKSNYLYDLHKSGAFKVSGHFRWQPCKDAAGLDTKKLIFISDFVKTGYTTKKQTTGGLVV